MTSEPLPTAQRADTEGLVCLAHLTDDILIDRLRQYSVQGQHCSFCSGHELLSSVRQIVEVVLVADEVLSVVRIFYKPAVSVLPWSSSEGGFQGPTLDTVDVVYEFTESLFVDQYDVAIRQAVVDRISRQEDTWTDGDSPHSVGELKLAWAGFVRIVKEESRFVFVPVAAVDTHTRVQPSIRVANFLNLIIPYVDGRHHLITEIPPRTAFYRGRPVDDDGLSLQRLAREHPSELGPAPHRRAAANRMSPAGISMLYASPNVETALAELGAHGAGNVVMGAMRNRRTMRVLDFTQTPQPISVFDETSRDEFALQLFLSSFVEAITKPVVQDGGEHIDYVPTQIVTEFLRWMPRTGLDGIALPSAQTGLPTWVMFYGPGCVGLPVAPDGQAWSVGTLPTFVRMNGPTFTLDPEEITIERSTEWGPN